MKNTKDEQLNKSTRELVIDEDSLYVSMRKCQKNVTWKPSVKLFVLNSEDYLYDMERDLKRGKWKNGKTKEVQILYPKKRKALSISFRDRVYQRSVNDNALYPQMTRHFIHANAACQKGKGTDFTRKLVKKYLQSYISKYGTEGYLLQIDIHQYYPSMDHSMVKECFKKNVDAEAYKMASEILDTQYTGKSGYNPGSQMVQIAGISFMNDIDHYIKEDLHANLFIRYQDDFWLLGNTESEVTSWFVNIEKKLSEKGFTLNEKKSHVTPLSKGFTFLGFKYRILDTGKIIMTLNSDNVKHERKKLARMTKKASRGDIVPSKIDECYDSWKNNAKNGNSYNLIRRTDKYLKALRNGGQNGGSKNNKNSTGTGRGRVHQSHCGKTEKNN